MIKCFYQYSTASALYYGFIFKDHKFITSFYSKTYNELIQRLSFEFGFDSEAIYMGVV